MLELVVADAAADIRHYCDYQGNVRQVVDAQGNVLEQNDYYPYSTGVKKRRKDTKTNKARRPLIINTQKQMNYEWNKK